MNETDLRSWKIESLDSFYIEEISDLVAEIAVGGAAAAVKVGASATGNTTLTAGYVTTFAEQFAKGGSIAFGYGTSMAIGNNPSSGASATGSGNIVFSFSNSITNAYASTAFASVVAIDI